MSRNGKVAAIFLVAGLSSGVATLAAIRADDSMVLVAPGVALALGILASIKTCQRLEIVGQIPGKKFLAALGIVVAAYPAAVANLLLFVSLSMELLFVLAGSTSYNTRFDLYSFIAFGVGLLAGALTAAFLVWSSLRVLSERENLSIRRWMLITSVLVAFTVMGVDGVIRYGHGVPPESETRARVLWAAIFVPGQSLFLLLYGLGISQTGVSAPSAK